MQFSPLMLLLVAPVLVLSVEPVFNDDVLGLIVFKAGLEDPQAKLSAWNEDDHNPCNWVGVKCDPTTNRVTALVLEGFSLSGHINKGLLKLQSLQILSLSRNNFTGTINPDLPRRGSLQVVDLSENSLSGSIPDGFFQQCGSLRSVSFARNNLTGKIPDSLSSCSTLATVNFSSNKLHGELPTGIWFLRGLQSLDLSNNLLEREIPEGIQNLYDLRELSLQKNRFIGSLSGDIGGCLLLKSLDFSDNFFSGRLPESLQRLNACTSLRLQGNSFTGGIPDWIGDLKNLEILDLSANRFFGWIPKSMGNLDSLNQLNLSRNRLTGNLPESMINCIKLLTLDASHNQLADHLPSWVFRMGSQSIPLSGNSFSRSNYPSFTSIPASFHGLQVLDLSSNVFSGELLSSIGGLSSLQVLNMSTNNISGPIPASIGELKSLYILDLSDNNISGSIPSEIKGAISLSELRLQKNYLSGRIPVQIEKCSSLKSLILSHNKLTGTIPAAISNLTILQNVDFSWNELSGSLPKELTNLSHLISFNVSYNHLQGELPVGGFFNTIIPSSVSGNPSLCGSIVNHSCPSVHPKPLVLNPNSSDSNSGGSSKNYRHKKTILSISVLIAISAAAFIAVGIVVVTVLNIHVRCSMSRSAAPFAFSGGDDHSCSPTNDPKYGKLVMFSGDTDFADGAHNLLNKDSEIGRGGFGVVYLTVLRDGHSVAIKKLTVSSLIKSRENCESEVKKLGRIRHQNLVALEGYYWTLSLQLLIYEYLSRGSLHRLLHNENSKNILSWRQRFRVILGMAKGLAYLHQMNIIHYNLKSTNVLIDCSGEPKIGDFGLVRLLPTLDHCVLSKIQSALGYTAPEFACRTVKITEKCDVYGFGILVLEVVTGERPVEYMEDDVVVLLDMVRGALEEGRVEQCVDRRLLGNFVAEEAIPAIKLGLVCASQVPSNRPDMAEVVNILELIQCPSEGQEEFD